MVASSCNLFVFQFPNFNENFDKSCCFLARKIFSFLQNFVVPIHLLPTMYVLQSMVRGSVLVGQTSRETAQDTTNPTSSWGQRVTNQAIVLLSVEEIILWISFSVTRSRLLHTLCICRRQDFVPDHNYNNKQWTTMVRLLVLVSCSNNFSKMHKT